MEKEKQNQTFEGELYDIRSAIENEGFTSDVSNLWRKYDNLYTKAHNQSLQRIKEKMEKEQVYDTIDVGHSDHDTNVRTWQYVMEKLYKSIDEEMEGLELNPENPQSISDKD